MAIKSFRKVLNHSSSSDTVVSNTSTLSSNTSTPESSRTPSSTNLPSDLADLLNSATICSVPTASTQSLALKKSTSSSSSFRSLIRSFSNKSEDPLKYAPKKFKWRAPNPEMIATLGAWDMSGSWGSERRLSAVDGICPRDCIEDPYGNSEHVESC